MKHSQISYTALGNTTEFAFNKYIVYRMPALKYIKQLDSIRAIAVILVLVWHWLPKESYFNVVRTGPFGVTVFFVLSGFLITRILLDNRDEAEEYNHSLGTVIRSFYIRRVLRIFPAYYFTLLLVIVLHDHLHLPLLPGELFANLTYTSNFYVFNIKTWPTLTPHFWSLAVEEQFYLVWPLAILFLPRRLLPFLIIIFIGTGIISQFLASDPEFSYVLPQTCLDALGMGGLLAWIVVTKPGHLKKAYLVLNIAATLGLLVMILDWCGLEFYHQWRILYSIFGSWIICYILVHQQKRNIILSVLNNSVLIAFGRVSYGIYLYHVLFFYLFYYRTINVFYHYLPFVPENYFPYLFFLVDFWVLYFLCKLSWYILEKPVLDLKRYFIYNKPASDTDKAMSKRSINTAS
jgi:peptidoglycan/LPS O-acetylase OafA/YrhL